MSILSETLIAPVCFALIAACATSPATSKPAFDRSAAIGLLECLSDDSLKGRLPGTPESEQTQRLISERLASLGVTPLGQTYSHPFTYGDFSQGLPNKTGTNLYGIIEGQSKTAQTLVMTAHFDHLGVVDGEIYNGADDNASGTVGLLALAEHFATELPENTIIFAFLDAEEDGFGGANAFIADPPLPLEKISFNLNLDMIARGDNGLLWASGTAHWPQLIPLVDGIASHAPVTLKKGFDQGDGRDDWTLLSDHAAFFRAGIPHLYLAVEDHIDYHKPSDDFENVDTDWFLKSIETIILTAEALDTSFDTLFENQEGGAVETVR